MEQKELTNTYQSPKVTVVAFKIEQGFRLSMKAEPLNSTPGTEDVTANEDGNLNEGYFPRNI